MKGFLYFLCGACVFTEISMFMRATHGIEEFSLNYIFTMIIIGCLGTFFLFKGRSLPPEDLAKHIPIEKKPSIISNDGEVNSQIKLGKALIVILNSCSVLEKLLDVTNDSQFEIYLFNLVYGWGFLKDNNVIPMNVDNIHYYQLKFIDMLNARSITIDEDLLLELFVERTNEYFKELRLIRQTQLNDNVYFPNYFYNRVFLFPFKMNDLSSTKKFALDDYPDDVLTDLFIKHVNYLEDEFNRNLFPVY